MRISSLEGTIQDQANTLSASIKQTSAWAVGPRLGWLPSSQTMTYVNGGYTGARFSGESLISQFNGAPSPATTTAFTASGWFVGGGVETTFDFFGMLGKGWFWRNEYRYASYGNKTVTELNGGAHSMTSSLSPWFRLSRLPFSSSSTERDRAEFIKKPRERSRGLMSVLLTADVDRRLLKVATCH